MVDLDPTDKAQHATNTQTDASEIYPPDTQDHNTPMPGSSSSLPMSIPDSPDDKSHVQAARQPLAMAPDSSYGGPMLRYETPPHVMPMNSLATMGPQRVYQPYQPTHHHSSTQRGHGQHLVGSFAPPPSGYASMPGQIMGQQVPHGTPPLSTSTRQHHGRDPPHPYSPKLQHLLPQGHAPSELLVHQNPTQQHSTIFKNLSNDPFNQPDQSASKKQRVAKRLPRITCECACGCQERFNPPMTIPSTRCVACRKGFNQRCGYVAAIEYQRRVQQLNGVAISQAPVAGESDMLDATASAVVLHKSNPDPDTDGRAPAPAVTPAFAESIGASQDPYLSTFSSTSGERVQLPTLITHASRPSAPILPNPQQPQRNGRAKVPPAMGSFVNSTTTNPAASGTPAHRFNNQAEVDAFLEGRALGTFVPLEIEDDDVNLQTDADRHRDCERMYRALLNPPGQISRNVSEDRMEQFNQRQKQALVQCENAMNESPHFISACCYKVYFNAIHLHKHGIPEHIVKAGLNRNSSYYKADRTTKFSDRLGAIITAASENKHVAYDVISNRRLEDLVYSPATFVKRKIQNVLGNNKKAEQLQGNTLKSKDGAHNEPDGEEDDAGGYGITGGAKKKRVGKTQDGDDIQGGAGNKRKR